MALGQLPPWLAINPNDFLHATAAGTQMGHAIAEATQRAWENQQRMKMEEEHGQEVLAQQAIQNAMQRLAQDRLEQYRQQEVANRTAQLGLDREGLSEHVRRNTILEGIRAEAESRQQQAENRRAEADQRKAGEPVFRGGRWWKNDPEQGPIPLTPEVTKPAPMDPLQRAFMGADAATLRQTERDIVKRNQDKPSGLRAWIHPGYQSDTDALKKEADAMREEMKLRYGSTPLQSSESPAPSQGTGKFKILRVFDPKKVAPITPLYSAENDNAESLYDEQQ